MKPQIQLIDPEEITTNYQKTDWAGIAYLVVAALAVTYIIAHIVAFVNANAAV